jgi:hypothetical protein
MTRPLGHTPWCGGGHRCNLGEHRADPIVVNLSGVARGVLTRIRNPHGDDRAEIRIGLALHPDEAIARQQLRTLLAGLNDLLGRAAVTTRHTGR